MQLTTVLSAVLIVVRELTNKGELLLQRQMLVHLMAALHVYMIEAFQKVVYVLFKANEFVDCRN